MVFLVGFFLIVLVAGRAIFYLIYILFNLGISESQRTEVE